MYRAFVGIVARGRKKSVEEIERVAEGRVWSGADGRARGAGRRARRLRRRVRAGARALARAKLGERAKALEPRVVRARRHPPPPLNPPARAARGGAPRARGLVPGGRAGDGARRSEARGRASSRGRSSRRCSCELDAEQLGHRRFVGGRERVLIELRARDPPVRAHVARLHAARSRSGTRRGTGRRRSARRGGSRTR